jgi:hypothetical protein
VLHNSERNNKVELAAEVFDISKKIALINTRRDALLFQPLPTEPAPLLRVI